MLSKDELASMQAQHGKARSLPSPPPSCSPLLILCMKIEEGMNGCLRII